MILINGESAENSLAQDRGFMYGDGIFRTLHISNGVPKFWDRQYKKLRADCNRILIDCPSEQILLDDLNKVCREQGSCAVKIIITRGKSERGYKLGLGSPTRAVISSPMPNYSAVLYEQGAKIRICDLRLAWQEKLAGIKHLNRLENVLARMEWDDNTIFEGLLFDIEENLIEGTMSNIFLVKNGGLLTSDLKRCGVAGVSREIILEIAREQKINCDIRHISMSDLVESDEAFLCNSLLGVCSIKEMPGKAWNQMEYGKKIRQFFNVQIN